MLFFFFFFQAEDGIRDGRVTGVQTCALPISEVLIPLALAILLAFLLAPAVRRLERWKLGRVGATIIVSFLGFGIILGVSAVAATQAVSLAEIGRASCRERV